MLKIHRVDVSVLYDTWALSFNMANKIGILNINNVDILESLKLGAFASNVSTNSNIVMISFMIMLYIIKLIRLLAILDQE